MSIKQFLMQVEAFEIQRYERPIGAAELKRNCTAFSGLLFRRAGDPGTIVLLEEPPHGRTVYYEFRIADIPYMEQVSNAVTPDGKVAAIARVWVKKGAVGIRCLPFAVEEPQPL
ncbi:MAG: inorganic pyrophosphatase Ppa [Thermodesulfobacteriota bacterium]